MLLGKKGNNFLNLKDMGVMIKKLIMFGIALVLLSSYVLGAYPDPTFAWDFDDS